MYAVIFKATTKNLDDEYFRTAEKLRELAFNKYGCLDFVAVTEGDEEITISYWETMQQIHNWKNDPEHRFAQQAGIKKWYKSYRVEICEVNRFYQSP